MLNLDLYLSCLEVKNASYFKYYVQTLLKGFEEKQYKSYRAYTTNLKELNLLKTKMVSIKDNPLIFQIKQVSYDFVLTN